MSDGVIEEFSHRDHGASRIVSSFVVGDSDDEVKAQSEEDHICHTDGKPGERC
ncbi:hypothetical protein [Haloarcula hispanica]|uniref:hypothetical protein n=1 Tax=Haloarcula hispanica TaxID=51589 RepID=UPI00177B179F|nr:hypothetical protein [Haloarcula hispanica]